MAYHNPPAGPSSQQEAFPNFDHPGSSTRQQTGQPQFDIFEWYPEYQTCHKYFLDHAQHTVPVQALAAFMNIILPYQRPIQPVFSSTSSTLPPPNPRPLNSQPSPSMFPQHQHSTAHSVSLIPYIRRLIATGHDYPGILHGLFGDTWEKGVGPLQEIERRNYLFAAKSGGWASVKAAYDMPPNEFVPFLQPLRNPSESEVQQAEESWSDWLKMEDWMIGPRSPDSPRDIKKEPGMR